MGKSVKIENVIKKIVNLKNTFELEGMSPMGDEEIHVYKIKFSPKTNIFTMSESEKETYRKVWGFNSINDSKTFFGTVVIQVDQITVKYLDEDGEVDSYTISKPIVRDIKYGFDLINSLDNTIFKILPGDLFDVDFEIVDSNGNNIFK